MFEEDLGSIVSGKIYPTTIVLPKVNSTVETEYVSVKISEKYNWLMLLSVCRKSIKTRKTRIPQNSHQFNIFIRKLSFNFEATRHLWVFGGTFKRNWIIRTSCHRFWKRRFLCKPRSYKDRKFSRNFVCATKTCSCSQSFRTSGNWHGSYWL